MLLLRLKSTSRSVFEDIQKAMDSVEEEMEKADKVLVDVHRLESEISTLKRTVANYTSFRYCYGQWMILSTPQFDSISLPPPQPEHADKTLFEQRCEGLQEELKERKRYSSWLGDIQIEREVGCRRKSEETANVNNCTIETSCAECG